MESLVEVSPAIGLPLLDVTKTREQSRISVGRGPLSKVWDVLIRDLLVEQPVEFFVVIE